MQLSVFRSVAYSHVLAEKRKNFDAKREKCIFIGYSDHTKGYKLFNPVIGAILISCDIRFSEDESWEWMKSEKMQLCFPIDGVAEQGDQQSHDYRIPVIPLLLHMLCIFDSQ